LFCGTGSLGLEALSRGAEFVTFVEQDPKVVAVLNRNIEKAAFVKESKVITANALRLGFVDPPYACTLDAGAGSRLSGLLNLVSEHVNPSGFVVVRTNKRTELMEWYGHLRVSERREWGTMAVTILQRVDE
jgi:16S rRNA G966 N2-methylase RsmD